VSRVVNYRGAGLRLLGSQTPPDTPGDTQDGWHALSAAKGVAGLLSAVRIGNLSRKVGSVPHPQKGTFSCYRRFAILNRNPSPHA
jgi:hypothetical protein